MLVPGEVDVALDAVGAVGQCLEVGGPGVFGKGGAGAPVGINQGPVGCRLVDGHADTVADPATVGGTRLGTCR